MEFGLLGPLLVKSGEMVVPVPAARQRVLLAALLVRANAVVSVDELVEALWEGGPPPTARVTAQNYVKRLRQALGDADHCRIATRPGGYLIQAGDGELDVTRFEALHDQGRGAARRGEWVRAAACLHDALALWRGRPLADVPCDLLASREVPRLEELRLRAIEARIDADLHLGLQAEAIAELRRLVASHPLRESLHGLLMLALYWAGRQADALAAYRQARHLIIEELGVEPGAGLQRLHQQILASDPGLDVPPEGRSMRLAGARTVIPRQLPPPPPYFAARGSELEMLNQRLEAAAKAGGTVAIAAIDGIAGAGKTALGLHWAHQVAQRFPDGQLYVNLRGFDPSGTPLTTAEAICGFLDALGVPADRVPAGHDAKVGLYRSLLAGKRMLIVLDNAGDEEQVRPLLPGGPGCRVLVTSRRRLLGLAAAEGVHPISLDMLTHAEARGLLARRLGADRIAAEPAAVTELTGRCAGLPLALSIVAARSATRPDLSLAALASDLRDATRRLDTLDAGDTTTSVRSVFSWSCRGLSAPAARMFPLLGLHPGPDVTAAAAASLAALPLARARQALHELTRARLVEEHVAGRFACHDLLRAYAAEQAAALEDQAERTAALHRMLDHYLHSAQAAARRLHPAGHPVAAPPPLPGTTPEHPATCREALDWFRAERRVLLAVIALAASRGFDVCAWQLPAALRGFFTRRGYWDDWAATHRIALTAAERLGDQAAQALAHRNLGDALIQLGLLEDAQAHLRQALSLYRRTGDLAGLGASHISAGRIFWEQGQRGQALRHFCHALRHYRTVGERAGQAYALNGAGWLHAHSGNHRLALTYCQQALGLHREEGDRYGEAGTLDSLAYLHRQAGRYDQAVAFYQRAITACRDAGDRYSHAETLIHLSETHRASGNPEAARAARQRAAAILGGLPYPALVQLRSSLTTGEGPDSKRPAFEVRQN